MKPKLNILFLLIAAAVSSCIRPNAESESVNSRNPHGLEIIQTIRSYDQTVRQNTDNTLIDLETEIPDVRLDIRYASKNNFTGAQIYSLPKAFLRKPAAFQLKIVQEKLKAKGLGLTVYDAYRPYSDTLRFFEIVPDPAFCADPRYGSRHNRGCAVDVSLYDLESGLPLQMPSDYDDFSEKAHPAYSADPVSAANRDLLIAVMETRGFKVYPTEWWHFDFKGWEKYPLMDIRFEELIRNSHQSVDP
jgi:D-alanyl-D-alanine dipeptidase